MSDFLLALFALLFVGLVLYLIAYWGFGLRFRVVPEEKRLVIYRLGKFYRVAGPGVVPTWRFDTIERELNARDEPHNLRVDNLYMHGIPFGYTLNMWLRNDPVAVAGDDKARLHELALFNDRERKQQIEVKLREALVHVVTRIQEGHKLRKNALTFEKLLPIFPGLPLCEQLLEQLKDELKVSLPSIGIKLNENQPITITVLHLTQTILNGFKQGHIANYCASSIPIWRPNASCARSQRLTALICRSSGYCWMGTSRCGRQWTCGWTRMAPSRG
ncbi:MAG: hypothetical protein R2867_00285 [Caldilineaceae bacterium]